MSNQNTEPNTSEPLHPQQKLQATTETSLQKSVVKPSQLFADTENPANNMKVINVTKPNNSIFGNNNRPSQNIFGQSNNSKTVNLFNISSVPQTTGTNIFNSASKPMIATRQDEDEKSQSNASSEGVRKAQTNFKSIPEKLEMKFKYENPWTVVKTYNLRKFKNGVNSSKEHIYLTLQRNSQYPDKLYFLVRARETKVLLFQGFGVKNVTDKISTFMNKDENLKLNVITQLKSKEDAEEEAEVYKPQFVKEELKMQFESMEEVKEFRERMAEEFGEKKEEKVNEGSKSE